MSEARNDILKRIRTGLGREELTEKSKRDLNEILGAPMRSITPGRVRLSEPELAEEFIRMTTGEGTTLYRVKGREDVPEAVAAFLRELGLPNSVALAPESNIVEMPWGKEDIQVRSGRAEKDDITGVTPAFAGIAETGCFLLLSGPNHPIALNLLPENHIVVLERTRIVATPEEAFGLLRKEFGPGNMPRTTLMVSGPSRSADVGTSLQFGAHGPRRLHCILLD